MVDDSYLAPVVSRTRRSDPLRARIPSMLHLAEEGREQSLDLKDVVLGGELLQAAVGQISLLLSEHGTVLIRRCRGILLSQLRYLRQLVTEWMRCIGGTGRLTLVLSRRSRSGQGGRRDWRRGCGGSLGHLVGADRLMAASRSVGRRG